MGKLRKAIEWAITLFLAAFIFLILSPYFLIRKLFGCDIHEWDYDEY